MGNSTAEVKGAVLLGLLKDAKSLPGGIPELMEMMSADVREAYFASNIVHGKWYSYGALASLLDAYSRLPGKGGAAHFRELGARMAERDFTSLLKIYAMVATLARLADVPRQVWVQRFRNAGTASSQMGDKNFRCTISEFPEIHPLLCEILTGYGGSVGHQKDGRFFTVHDRCVHRGDPDCSWLSTW
jgi:hypothetical protein